MRQLKFNYWFIIQSYLCIFISPLSYMNSLLFLYSTSFPTFEVIKSLKGLKFPFWIKTSSQLSIFLLYLIYIINKRFWHKINIQQSPRKLLPCLNLFQSCLFSNKKLGKFEKKVLRSNGQVKTSLRILIKK